MVTGGAPLTVTGGSVTLRMVPNDVTATVSLELETAAGDRIDLKNIQFRTSGETVAVCQTD